MNCLEYMKLSDGVLKFSIFTSFNHKNIIVVGGKT